MCCRGKARRPEGATAGEGDGGGKRSKRGAKGTKKGGGKGKSKGRKKAAELPEGWEEVSDGEGDHYYYNGLTKQSTWTRPKRGEDVELTGDKPRKHTIGSGRSGEPGDRETGDAALPAGWEELSDANGDTYFYDHTERRATWTRPEAQGIVMSGKL